MSLRSTGGPGRIRSILVTALALTLFVGAGCGSKDKKTTTPRGPARIVASTTAELISAFQLATAGDTIEVVAGFSSNQFTLPTGFTFSASQSPLVISGSQKSTLRPEIIFPEDADGLVFEGHMGSEVKDIDFRYARNVIVLHNSEVHVDDVTIRQCRMDGVTATGAASTGVIENSLFEDPGRFGVSTYQEATPTIQGNTIIRAGDCGIYLETSPEVRRNLILQATQFGIICASAGIAPTIECNDAYDCTINFNCPAALVLPSNFERNPEFCGSSYSLKDFSPCAPANSGGCGLIGAYGPVECPPSSGNILTTIQGLTALGRVIGGIVSR